MPEAKQSYPVCSITNVQYYEYVEQDSEVMLFYIFQEAVYLFITLF